MFGKVGERISVGIGVGFCQCWQELLTRMSWVCSDEEVVAMVVVDLFDRKLPLPLPSAVVLKLVAQLPLTPSVMPRYRIFQHRGCLGVLRDGSQKGEHDREIRIQSRMSRRQGVLQARQSL
jgi:hypothetical protein